MIKVYINLGYCTNTKEEDFIFWDSYLNLESAITDMLQGEYIIKGLVRFDCSFYELVPYLCSGATFLPVDNEFFKKLIYQGGVNEKVFKHDKEKE